MIKVHFVVRRKTDETKSVIGKVSSIGFHIVEQPNVRKGLVRLTGLNKDLFNRTKNNQLVLTPDGMGHIKDLPVKKNPDGHNAGVNVRVRGLNKTKTFYKLDHIKVIDIVDNKTGQKYPVVEKDYPHLLLDDAPVSFYINKNGRAGLTLDSREQYANVKIFAKKLNGIRLFNELITKKVNTKEIWSLIKR
jgi:hypothetical protein